MKTMIALLLFFLPTSDLVQVRKLFPHAAQNQVAAAELYAILSGYSGDNQTIIAYKGAAMTLQSKFAKKIPEKVKWFKEGAKLIESAVAKEPANAELRMIRLSVQENVPGIVKYRQNKEEDRRFLLESYPSQGKALKEYLRNFILSSSGFSEAEKSSLK